MKDKGIPFGNYSSCALVTGAAGGMGGVLQVLPIERLFPVMTAVALALGVGIGFFVSFFTIRRHLKV